MFVMWSKDMYITKQDREWRKFIGEYVRNEEEEQPDPHKAVRSFQQFAPVDRFNYGQKYLFWVMFWGGITLFVTGMILWFSEYIPWSLRFLRLALHHPAPDRVPGDAGRVHHSRVYGNGGGARRLQLRHSRRGLDALGEVPSSPLAGPDYREEPRPKK